MALKLRDPEVAAGSGGRDVRKRAAGWRGWLLGLMLLLAFVEAGVVLYLVGGLVEGVSAAGIVGLPTVEESPLSEKTAPGFDAEALRGRIEEIVEGRWGAYGVAVLEPASETRVSVRSDEEFVPASIGKLPVFAALYRAGALGELDLEEEIPIRSEDIQGYGSGGLNGFPVGYSLSLREIAYRLVNHSDNTAWAMLDRRLGPEKVRAGLEGMGIEKSRYTDYRSGYYTTPDDVLLLLQKISDPAFTSEELSSEMLDAMTETTLEDRIPEKLPAEVRVAHKTGSYEENFGDAGVVFYKDAQGVEKRYYLVVLARGAGEPEARDVIQNVSLAVYEALTGTRVDPGWSRHGGSAPTESDAGNPPAPLPSPAENPKKTATESTEPAKLPLDKKTPESRYNGPAEGLQKPKEDAQKPKEDAQKPKEDAKTTKPPPNKASSSGSWYNAIPSPPSKRESTSDPYAWEYAYSEKFAPTSDEETTYWEEEYSEYETTYWEEEYTEY